MANYGVNWGGDAMWMVAGGLHCIFGVLIFLAVVGIVIWLWKHAKKDEVKKFVIWALAIGIIGALVTAPFAFRGWSMKWDKSGYRMMPGMMWMDKDDAQKWMDSVEDKMEKVGGGQMMEGESMMEGEAEK